MIIKIIFKIWLRVNYLRLTTIVGADLDRGTNHSTGSLKQVVWGAVPPRSYRIFVL